MAGTYPVLLGSLLGFLVGISMLMGTMLVFIAIRSQPKSVLSATQYFSSGIIIAVIGQELVPDLEKAADGFRGSAAIAVGFAAGVCMMYAIEQFADDDEDAKCSPSPALQTCSLIECPDVSLASPARLNAELTDQMASQLESQDGARALTSTRSECAWMSNSITRPAQERNLCSTFPTSSTTAGSDRKLGSWIRSQGLPSRKRAKSTIVSIRLPTSTTASAQSAMHLTHSTVLALSSKRVPWALTLPIFIDAAMDGMLIGLMSATSEHGAIMLSIATAVEMGFLGITFGTIVMECGWKKWLLALLLPLTLTASGAAGAIGANVVADMFEVTITAFGIAALLFLACNELLKEASENMDEASSVKQSCWLFVGFFIIIMLERVLPNAGED